MKIIITGSHGVGKTTLGKQIFEYLDEGQVQFGGINERLSLSRLGNVVRFDYLKEAPLQAHEAGFSMNENTSFEAELWMFTKQVEMEMRSENSVGDKGFIDLLAYAEYLFRSDEELLRVLRRIAMPKIKEYDLVIYLPIGEFPIEDDGLRSLDPTFQEGVDAEILKILHKNKVNYTRIVGDAETRFLYAIRLLEGALSNLKTATD